MSRHRIARSVNYSDEKAGSNDANDHSNKNDLSMKACDDTSNSKPRAVGKHEARGDDNIPSGFEVDNLRKCEATLISKNLENNIRLSKQAETPMIQQFESQCIIETLNDENNGQLSNKSSLSSSPSSNFSSLKALMMKHKQSRATRSKGLDESGGKGDQVSKVSSQVAKKTDNLVLEGDFENRKYIGESENRTTDPSTAKLSEKKLEISSENVKEVKLHAARSPGRSSSLSALAKRCRNLNDRRVPPTTNKPLQIVADEPGVGARASSLPLEFEKINVQSKDISPTILSNECDKIGQKMTYSHADGKDLIDNSHSTPKHAVFIDLMTALHSSSDEESDVKEESSFVSADSQKRSDILEVRTSIISNILKVKNEFQSVSCSPFGEIICKEYIFHYQDFDCVPEVINSEVKPFAFDVMSPDDEILQFRKNW